ncbi:MAG: hypothetical protein HY237_09485 [Acidobacteria bacterium]|nr:hypothetical protein [Acidobacteriota bacterium]
MGPVNSTPLVDYQRNIIWVTTRNFSSLSIGRPNLWKINANNGAVLGIANLTLDVDASPTLTRFGDVLFVATDNVEVKAVSPTLDDGSGPPPLVTTLATYPVPAGVGLIQKGFPLVLNFSSPYTIIVTRNTSVHAVSFDTTGNVFTNLWNTTLPCNVSAPIGFTGLSTVYVGCDDGKIHELNLATGVDQKQRIVNTTPVTVGDPSLDVELSLIIVGATDGRVYAFTFPF